MFSYILAFICYTVERFTDLVKQPDAEWRTRISAIQDASTTADDTSSDRHNGFKVSRKVPKRSKASVIPNVHTYHATEASVTLEGIDNVEDFVEKLDLIEPPGQMISYLTDPLLQKYVELKPEPIVSTRIDLWLSTCLEDLYEGERLGNSDPQYVQDMLDGLFKHAEHAKELHPSVLSFLESYLQIWDGRNYTDAILGLLAHIPINSFQDAYEIYILPAERALASQGPSTYSTLIAFYTCLLQQQVCTVASQGTPRSPADLQIFHDLSTHVSTLSTSLLLSLSPGSGHTLTSSILTFYELLPVSSKPHIVPIIVPPMRLVSLLLQHASPSTFSRTCGIIGACKRAFDEHPVPVKNYYPSHVTDPFNWCLRDIFHLLWISRALVITDKMAMGLHCDPTLRLSLHDYLTDLDREYAIDTAFGLANNTWLASLSAAAWRSMEEREIRREGFDRTGIRFHQGPVSRRSLEVLKKKGGVSVEWGGAGGYKAFVLSWLAERGLAGMRDVMFASVPKLRGDASGEQGAL
jgi:centromere protein I